MLDHCSISHKGGVVFWSRSFTPAAAQVASSPASPVNSLIREVLIEGRTDEKYEKDGYAIQWTFMNELELIFVVAYQRILQLTYVEELLNALKSLFVKLFEPFLATFVASLHTMSNAAASAITRRNIQDWNFAKAFEGWDKVFDKLLRGLQDKVSLDKKSRFRNTPVHITDVTLPSDDDATDPAVSSDAPVDAEQIAKNVHTLKSKSRGRGRGRGRGGSTRTDSGSGKDSPHASDSEISKSKKKAKTQRKWGDEVPSESEMASLDFSIDKTQASSNDISATFDVKALIDESSLGTRAQNGLYEIKDWEFSKRSDKETDDLVARTLQAKLSTNQQLSGPTGTLSSLFSRLTGSKTLNESDVRPVLDSMQQHLMKKNVAKEIAEKVCEGVEEGLIGKKLSSFQTVSTSVRQALSTSLTRILTPNTSTDLLMSIRSKLSSPLPSKQQRLPFSIAFVGVNGVGKSTNLSKVCFWLIQNGFKVLIAACDTFRSGAVEQLRVHVRNLSLLDVAGPEGRGGVELFERGYGKDAAGIAKEAITYARDNDFDVVLIDTAGRMQDNEPLMRALAKLVAVNNPDKIIFVGEALVGNEAVDQLTKFDRALKDFSSATGGTGKGRGIDGMLVTKWDTVDDKVGAALSMTFVTGQPIYFVGCGQTYTDLRQLRVSNVVQALLSD